jgi:hypothetical protein
MDFQATEGGAGCCIEGEGFELNIAYMLNATEPIYWQQGDSVARSSSEFSDSESEDGGNAVCSHMVIEEKQALGSPRSERSRNKERAPELPESKKYSDLIKTYLKENNIGSIELLDKAHVEHLKEKFGIQTHQVKRVASSYFSRGKGAGRPERYTKTNDLMKLWSFNFVCVKNRAPTIEETISEGTMLKNQTRVDLEDENDWKCSKGWAKRFLIKNGLRGMEFSQG